MKNETNTNPTATPIVPSGVQAGNPPVAPVSQNPQKSLFSKIPHRKTILIASLAIIGLLIVMGLSLFVVRKGTDEVSKRVQPEPIALKDSQVNTSKYIESQRNKDGSYAYQAHADVLCSKENGKLKCPFNPNNTSFPANAWSALGHYSAYKVSLETEQLDRARRDLDMLMKFCSDTKNDCTYLLTQPAIINADLKSIEVKKFLTIQAGKLVNAAPSTNLMLVGIEVRELALLSEVLEDPTLLRGATLRMSIAEKQLQKESIDITNNNVVFPQFACWVTLAQVELGRVAKKEQMIVNAVEYLKQNDRISVINNYENPVKIQPCIETLLIAGSSTPYGYKSYGQGMLTTFKNNFYDTPDNEIAYAEYGTTYYPKSMIATGSPKYIFLADTSYTNYLNYLSTK